MKDILIKRINKDPNNGYNPYELPLKDYEINSPQIINLSQSCVRGNRYYFSLIDSRLDGIDSPCVGVKLPEIKGKGSVRFIDYPGLKLIKSFEINVNSKLVIKLNGIDIYSAYHSPNTFKDDSIVGHREDYCNYKKGDHLDHTLFNSIDLFVPIFTQFDRSPPHTILRTPKNAKIEFVIELNSITDILSYDREFYNESLDMIRNLTPEIKMSIRAYNIQTPTKIEDKFIELNEFSHIREELFSSEAKDEFFTNTFKSISEIGWFCKTDQFTKQFFISHPGFNANEKDYINAFRKRLFPDLIRISDDIDKFKDDFPEDANFVFVENNGYHEFDNLNKCKILIRNIPKTHKIWFHTNILEFNRSCRTDNYNISKKFKYILGDYIKEENRILPLEIIDDLCIEDVSVPVDLWNHKYNTAGKDLRSYSSKIKDVYVNEPYIFGFDFVAKELGFEKDTTIKAGPSERIVENNRFNFYASYFGYNHGRSYYFLENNKFPCIGNSNFNVHNLLINKPSTLDYNKDKNILSCSIEVKWKNFNDNNPLKLVKKTLYIFIKKIVKVKYLNNNIEIVE